MKFKVGDKVRVLPFDVISTRFKAPNRLPNNRLFTREMSQYCGTEAIINKAVDAGHTSSPHYTISVDRGASYWDDYMLEPIDSISTDSSRILSVLSDHPEAEAALSELFPDVVKKKVNLNKVSIRDESNKEIAWRSLNMGEEDMLYVEMGHNAEIVDKGGYQYIKFTRK